MKVEVAVLGSPSLIVYTVSVDVKEHLKKLRSCVKVEVDVQSVRRCQSVDVKPH